MPADNSQQASLLNEMKPTFSFQAQKWRPWSMTTARWVHYSNSIAHIAAPYLEGAGFALRR